MNKKRILFVGESVSLAHIARPLYLAESLNPNEYEIHFACDERYQSFVDKSPIRYWPINSVSSDAFLDALSKGGFVPTEKDVEANISQELSLIEEVKPSIIINDLRFSMTISAEISNTLNAMLANVHWSPYRELEFNPFMKFSGNSLNGLNLGKRITRKAINVAKKGFSVLKSGLTSIDRNDDNNSNRPSATDVFNTVRKKYSLCQLSDYSDLATRGDYTLYVEPPGFIPTKNKPEKHIFIGPTLWEPNVTLPTWWSDLDDKSPIIYITLGSTGAAEFLENIVSTLQDLPVNILIATAGRMNFENSFSNVFIADYLPGIKASKLASVVICNGGSATAYQAISQGTPLIGIWNNLDQYLTMMIIERKGFGIGVRTSDLDMKKLKTQVEIMILDKKIKENALEIQRLFNQYDSRILFQEFLKKIL